MQQPDWDEPKTGARLFLCMSGTRLFVHDIYRALYRGRITRRTYHAPHCGYSWHTDCDLKAREVGISITGCVDGFSRRVIWSVLIEAGFPVHLKSKVLIFFFFFI